MPVLSNTAFTSWLQLYQSASDVPELNATESVDEIFTNGNSRDTDTVITSLLDFPFSGTYLAYAMPVSAPKFQGASVCVKYHVRGLCSFGDKCQRKHSHTNAFDNKAKADLDAWVKMCRKSAANK
jgi:hypothetical protein